MWILASFCTSQKVPGQTNRAEWCRWGWPACGRGWGVRQLDVGSARVPEALSALQISASLLKLSGYLALKSELWSVLLQDDHIRIWGRGRMWSPHLSCRNSKSAGTVLCEQPRAAACSHPWAVLHIVPARLFSRVCELNGVGKPT